LVNIARLEQHNYKCTLNFAPAKGGESHINHGGGSATSKDQNPWIFFFFFFFLLWGGWGWFSHPKPVKKVAQPPLFLFFLFFFFNTTYNSCQSSGVDTWRAVNFWTENLTKVLIRSFPKIEVLSMLQIKTQGQKHKVFKTQGPEVCFTLKIFN
jgi:hypothetical protein